MRYRVRYQPASSVLGRNVALELTAISAARPASGAVAAEAGFDACDVVVIWAYDAGTLTVTVTDPAGNPIPGAIVIATPVPP